MPRFLPKQHLPNTFIPSSLQCFYRLYNVQMIHPCVFCRVLGFLLWTLHESSAVVGRRRCLKTPGKPHLFETFAELSPPHCILAKVASTYFFKTMLATQSLEPRLALVCCQPIVEVFRFQSLQTPCV